MDINDRVEIDTAIVLAGGFGTRLRSAVPDLPKCMAPVAGRPFITYVIDYLRMQGIQKFIFSLGYKHEVIEAFLTDQYPTLAYQSVIEEEPLGTGGAIKLACSKCPDENVLIVNGDTLFKIQLKELAAIHIKRKAECTLALKPLNNFDRYGVVSIDENNKITSFHEKKFYTSGLINGGVYILNKEAFLKHGLADKFSFEKEYLETYYPSGSIYGGVQEGYFIDIGIPQDFEQAQADFARSILDYRHIDKSWTLFLDRDGVVNEEKAENYILNWTEFIFNKGVLNAFKILSNTFGRIVLVSNQRGIGKGLMTENDLHDIHKEMVKEVHAAGGHIDKIYYSTHMDNKHGSRKPNPGMALQALKDFPDMDLSKAVMVGNKPSDMRFGRSAGMFTVFLTTTNPEQPFPHPDIDLRFSSLLQFAEVLQH